MDCVEHLENEEERVLLLLHSVRVGLPPPTGDNGHKIEAPVQQRYFTGCWRKGPHAAHTPTRRQTQRHKARDCATLACILLPSASARSFVYASHALFVVCTRKSSAGSTQQTWVSHYHSRPLYRVVVVAPAAHNIRGSATITAVRFIGVSSLHGPSRVRTARTSSARHATARETGRVPACTHSFWEWRREA